MNAGSSRSHLVMTIRCDSHNAQTGRGSCSKLHLVDLVRSYYLPFLFFSADMLDSYERCRHVAGWVGEAVSYGSDRRQIKRSSIHQQIPVVTRRRDGVVGTQRQARSLSQLEVNIFSAGFSGRRLKDSDVCQHLSHARLGAGNGAKHGTHTLARTRNHAPMIGCSAQIQMHCNRATTAFLVSIAQFNLVALCCIAGNVLEVCIACAQS